MRTVLLAVVVLGAGACHASTPIHRPTDPRVNRAVDAMWARDLARVARTGDWILSRSYSTVGDVIVASTTGEELSHASIYDAERGTIIEALDPEVREVPLASLLERNRYVIVVRPTGLDTRARLASVARARAAVGTPFDYAGVFGIDAEDRFYCSELVVWAAGLAHGGLVVSPADLMAYGETVYFSGSRDDEATQRAALASGVLAAHNRRRALAAAPAVAVR